MRALTDEGFFVKAIFNAQGSIRARGIPVGVTCVSPMGWVGMENVYWTWPTKLVAADVGVGSVLTEEAILVTVSLDTDVCNVVTYSHGRLTRM